MSLPKSTNFTLQNLFEKDANKLLSIKHKKNVFIDDDEIGSRRAVVLAGDLGYKNIYALAGGLNKFKADILNSKLPDVIKTTEEADTYRFRTKASQEIPVLIKENKLKKAGVEKKQVKRIVGGC